ncbi:unnamed protein product [Meloidogyne enterolobii]|uniref:Uncharacterized protein n=1 Tax=Meloidogyne enterolobii TaxID=390850 RepID=A0ACB0XMJ8_MELEN
MCVWQNMFTIYPLLSFVLSLSIKTYSLVYFTFPLPFSRTYRQPKQKKISFFL